VVVVGSETGARSSKQTKEKTEIFSEKGRKKGSVPQAGSPWGKSERLHLIGGRREASPQKPSGKNLKKKKSDTNQEEVISISDQDRLRISKTLRKGRKRSPDGVERRGFSTRGKRCVESLQRGWWADGETTRSGCGPKRTSNCSTASQRHQKIERKKVVASIHQKGEGPRTARKEPPGAPGMLTRGREAVLLAVCNKRNRKKGTSFHIQS